ncbi:MAG: ABC transporter ATP-binding protein [Sulfolobales archaeon]
MLEASLMKPVLNVREVWVEFHLITGLLGVKKRVYALRGVSFSVLEREVYGIVGASGSGKSTLLKVIMGFVKPTAGTVEIDGIDVLKVDRETRKNITKRIGYVSQNPLVAVNPRFKVKDIIAEPLRAVGVPKREIVKILPTLVEAVGLAPEVMELLPYELSLGMLQRVVIARAIAAKPRMLLLDEPTSALDSVTQSHITALLRELRELFGYTSILVSHDLRVVSRLADKLAIMMAGLILEEGSVADVLGKPLHPYTQALVDSLKFKEMREVFVADPRVCPYYTNCTQRLEEKCRILPPLVELSNMRKIRCWLYT